MIHFYPRRLLTFSRIKTKAVLKGLGRCGQLCMTHASPAVDGAAPAPPTRHSGVQGRGGRCRGGRQIGPRLGTCSVLARMTKNYHDCRFSRRLLCPCKMSIRRGGKNVFNNVCDKSWSVPAFLSWLHSC